MGDTEEVVTEVPATGDAPETTAEATGDTPAETAPAEEAESTEDEDEQADGNK